MDFAAFFSRFSKIPIKVFHSSRTPSTVTTTGPPVQFRGKATPKSDTETLIQQMTTPILQIGSKSFIGDYWIWTFEERKLFRENPIGSIIENCIELIREKKLTRSDQLEKTRSDQLENCIELI